MFSLQLYFLDSPTSPLPSFIILCKLLSRHKIYKQKRAQMLTDQRHKSSQREHTWVSSIPDPERELDPQSSPCASLGPLFHPGVTTVLIFSSTHRQFLPLNDLCMDAHRVFSWPGFLLMSRCIPVSGVSSFLSDQEYSTAVYTALFFSIPSMGI